MKVPEFSTEFDILYNNITSNQAPGLNEYEKSVFLTKAQSQLLTEFFNNRTDGFGGGFDGSQKRQYDFSSIIQTKILSETIVPSKVDARSKAYLFPSDYFLSVNEVIKDNKYQYSVIPISYAEYQTLMLKPYNFPVKRAAWRLFTSKQDVPETPIVFEDTLFIWPNTEAVMRVYQSGTTYKHLLLKVVDGSSSASSSTSEDTLIITIGLVTVNACTSWEALCAELNNISATTNMTFSVDSAPQGDLSELTSGTIYSGDFSIKTSGSQPVAEVIGKFDKNNSVYTIRYIKKPNPIILDDLTNYGVDLSINGRTLVTECELPEETHHEILERAVTLAKIAWAGGTITQAAAQQRDRGQS